MNSTAPSEGTDHAEITAERSIRASRSSVWSAVGSPELLSRWWCAGDAVTIEFEPTAGGRFEEHYHGEAADHYELEGELLRYEEARVLAVRRDTASRFGPVDVIVITLHDDGDGTTVLLRHRFPALPSGRLAEAVGVFEESWAASLDALEALVMEQP